MHQIIVLSIAASLVILIADRSSAAENDRGAQLIATCASCHRLAAENPETRHQAVRQADSWYAAFTHDLFG
jgi:cytochrome c2